MLRFKSTLICYLTSTLWTLELFLECKGMFEFFFFFCLDMFTFNNAVMSLKSNAKKSIKPLVIYYRMVHGRNIFYARFTLTVYTSVVLHIEKECAREKYRGTLRMRNNTHQFDTVNAMYHFWSRFSSILLHGVSEAWILNSKAHSKSSFPIIDTFTYICTISVRFRKQVGVVALAFWL